MVSMPLNVNGRLIALVVCQCEHIVFPLVYFSHGVFGKMGCDVQKQCN